MAMDGRTAAGDEDYSTAVENEELQQLQQRGAKRRRTIRKGTHSCWACKRRKEKCTLDPSGGKICLGCRRRGTNCVSQEFPDAPSPTDGRRQNPNTSQMNERMERIESLIEQLLTKIQSASADHSTSDTSQSPRNSNNINLSNSNKQTKNSLSPLAKASAPTLSRSVVNAGIPTPASIQDSTCQPPCPFEALKDAVPPNTPDAPMTAASLPLESPCLRDLSTLIHRLLPSQHDIQILRQVSLHNPSISNSHLTKSYTTLQCQSVTASLGFLSEPPPATAHPVLIARYMLQIAILLQELPHDDNSELRDLSESRSEIMQRSANTAMAFVTNRDELLGSVESLECVMLESFFRCNGGQLRLSWMAARRAMLLAQVMGLHLPDGDRRHDLQTLDPDATYMEPRLVWFRISSYDLLLCRMLGLPPASTDVCPSPLVDCPDTPLGLLEYKQYGIMTEILKHKPAGVGSLDFDTTVYLDQELQKMTKAVPDSWWLAPNLSRDSDDPMAVFWDFRRLVVQIVHFDLLNQLYVPHMFSATRSAVDTLRANLSRAVCVSSSREVLSRCILTRDSNRAASSSCIFDFMGLMSAITLILAHLTDGDPGQDTLSSHASSLLAHQAPSDRAMMEHALRNMREVNRVTGDVTSARSADVLQRLLDIEAKRGHLTNVEHVSVHASFSGQDAGTNKEENVERVKIPYFGFIRIARPHSSAAAAPTSNSSNNEKQTEEHWDLSGLHMGFVDDFWFGDPTAPAYT